VEQTIVPSGTVPGRDAASSPPSERRARTLAGQPPPPHHAKSGRTLDPDRGGDATLAARTSAHQAVTVLEWSGV
jgi:hypothetical protein